MNSSPERQAERELMAALDRLLHVIESSAAEADLATALERVERLADALDGAPAPLQHYLQRRGYQKALEFLRQR